MRPSSGRPCATAPSPCRRTRRRAGRAGRQFDTRRTGTAHAARQWSACLVPPTTTCRLVRPPLARSRRRRCRPGSTPASRRTPLFPSIHQSNGFEFRSLSEARDLFALRKDGNIYSRAANPTVLVFERRVAELEGGIGAAGVASGQAAVAVALLALAKQGEHIVAARQLYGGTVDLLQDTFADWGIEVTFVDQDDIEAWRAAVRPTTRALFAESISNPIAQVLDLGAVAAVARAASVPLVIDNTVATPYLQRAKDFGADIVGALRDEVPGRPRHLARRRRRRPRHVRLHRRARALAPADADLPARPRRQPRRALRPDGVAVHRARQDEVRARPGPVAVGVQRLPAAAGPRDARPPHAAPHRERARRRAVPRDASRGRARCTTPGSTPARGGPRRRRTSRTGSSSVFAFDLPATGDAEADFRLVEEFISRLQVVRLVANIGDARSLVAHPASMTHSHMSPTQLAEAAHRPDDGAPVDRPGGRPRHRRRPRSRARPDHRRRGADAARQPEAVAR